MNVISENVPLRDNRVNRFVFGSLLESVPLERIIKTSLDWSDERNQIKSSRLSVGLSFPEHSHWNWEHKARQTEIYSSFQTLFAIDYEGEIQGLMIVDYATQLAKLPPDRGKPILYINYIESAPHNLYEEPRRFSGIGFNLYRTAILYSLDKECGGRVGLHALPQAEEFYARYCNMTPMEKDPEHENLRYFESTVEQSCRFINEEPLEK